MCWKFSTGKAGKGGGESDKRNRLSICVKARTVQRGKKKANEVAVLQDPGVFRKMSRRGRHFFKKKNGSQGSKGGRGIG